MVRKRNINVFACRVCLSLEKNKVIMDSKNGWLDFFNYCFGLQVLPTERARALCEQCADSIKKFALLKVKCLESNDVWNSRQVTEAPQFKMQLRNKNKSMEINNEEYLTESEELKVNKMVEVKIEDDTVSIKSDKTDFSIELEELHENDIDRKTLYCNNDESENHMIALESDISKVTDAKEKKNRGRNDDVSMEMNNEKYSNYSEELKDSTQILNIKKKNGSFSVTVDSNRTNYSIDQLAEQGDIVNEKLYCDNDGSVGKSENNVSLLEHVSFFSNTKVEMPCGCCLEKIDNNIKYNMHRKKCDVWKFYNLPENQTDALKSCGLCDFSTQNAQVLCQHFDEHYQRNDLDCKLCDYTGQDFANMAFHRYQHMPTDRSKLYCLICLKLFQVPKGLQFHFRSEHLQKQEGGLCFCGSAFTSVKKWRTHEKTKHYDSEKDRKVFICDCCGLKFRFRSKIIIHLLIRAGFYKTVCDECGAICSQKKNLKLHKKTKHSIKKRVKCPKCPKYVSEYCINSHIKRMHGEKNFICELCSAAYTTLKSLKYHMLEHTKERPHQCTECSASYKTKGMLAVHMRKHTGERPYVCNTCFKGFASLNQLKIHNSVHTNLRKYQCKECSRSFHGKKLLMKHCAKVHPEIAKPGQ